MDHYINITLLPDPEFHQNMLMSALFSKLHRALSSGGYNNVGVSFPKAGKDLGNILRLHGRKDSLEKLMTTQWQKGLNDFSEISMTKEVPSSPKYRVVSRAQSKSNIERLYRRSVKKGWLTQEEADARKKEQKDDFLTEPFVRIKSSSSGQYFRLFIRHGEFLSSPVAGIFSAYGLSAQATIPWF